MIKSVTFFLIAINVALFLFAPKAYAFTTDIDHPFNELLNFKPSAAFDMPWTFVTATFMHADITHILFNMFTLFMFGMLLESSIGPKRFLAFYLLAGVVGNLLFMGMAYSGIFPSPSSSVNPIDIVGLGASGSIMGVLGVLGLIRPHINMYVPLLPIPVPMWVGVILFAIFNIAISFVPSGIGTGAHLGGLAVGVVYGVWLRHQVKRNESRFRIKYVWE